MHIMGNYNSFDDMCEGVGVSILGIFSVVVICQ
jgi:hypothetical protein